MFQPLHNLFRKPSLPLDESDIKYGLQNWLREQMGSDQVVCQSVREGIVSVRVVAPALRQELALLDYDLRQYALKEYTYTIREVRITQR
jgi:hypothetical protein